MGSIEIFKLQCKMASEAIVNWKNYCRDICAEHLVLNPMILGGPGKCVEIDETAFVKRKYNVGHRVKTQWVFGGLEIGSRKCFLVAVKDRSADSLIPVLQKYVLPGTTVVSDLWKAYNSIGDIGYKHLKVNHSLNFVDPLTSACTNHIEALWNIAKRRNKREIGTHRSQLDSYMIEFMWRFAYKGNCLEQLFLDIKQKYQLLP